ncbi:multiprotein-bridging factor 1 family protein [Metabacillus herbersteinensis]|uniref:Multiprotein-bridging factor 1 family protein n=1 Tax=Metabacillus herbersteinensis TaxID=283816 RepID=A0ABV6GKE2_9BACI
MLTKPCGEFGEFIRYNREKNFISEESIAMLLNTLISFIKRMERGEVHPTDTFITEILKILSIPFDELKAKIWCDPPNNLCS